MPKAYVDSSSSGELPIEAVTGSEGPRLYGGGLVRRIFDSISFGMDAARHLTWYLSYQVTGETRPSPQS